ncbi:DAK1 DegV-like protein [Scleroderma citrinum]
MTDKHIFSSPDGLVLTSLRGAVALNPALRLHPPSRSVYIAQPHHSTHIALVSGGGAGHEPAHAGYTGRGMLTASVSGDIFASPSAKQILSAILFAAFAGLPHETTQPRDVLVIINNYTGDRLNFGLAMEQARSRFPNLNIASVLNADDVSLLPQVGNGTLVGPRGLAGNIFVCKVLGAYTTFGAKGAPSTEFVEPTLSRAKRLGDALVAHLRSIGATLGHCHVPGRAPHSGAEIIAPGFVELGLGLHNEPGVQRVALTSPTSLISEMVKMICTSGSGWDGSEIYEDQGALDPTELWIQPGNEMVLFINNLGGMSQLEMGAIVETIRTELATYNIFPMRIYSAPFMTSLNAPGFSISLVNITRIHGLLNGQDGEISMDVLALLDFPTDAHSWMGIHHWPSKPLIATDEAEAERTLQSITSTSLNLNYHITPVSASADWETHNFTPTEVHRGVRGACYALLEIERELTKFDTVLGDGDCGETFSRGARAILSALDTGVLNATTTPPSAFIADVGEIIEGSMGGTIGALFSIFFAAWSTAMRAYPPGFRPQQESALSKALVALSAHTPARPGDRTIIDALSPLCTISSHPSDSEVPSGMSQGNPQSFHTMSCPTTTLGRNEILARAASAAKEGAESTRHMHARLGRAAYLSGGGEGTPPVDASPDPGAWGIAAIAEGFVKGVTTV